MKNQRDVNNLNKQLGQLSHNTWKITPTKNSEKKSGNIPIVVPESVIHPPNTPFPEMPPSSYEDYHKK